jgi:hypothetical protein
MAVSHLSGWLGAAGLMLIGAPALGQDQPPSLAQEVKAAYLDKLGAFVEWPAAAFAAPAEPARLCVAGDDPFGDLLVQAVHGQRIASHPILVVRLDRVERGSACHILFAAGSPRQSVADVLEKVRGTPTLTVTDSAADPAARGMVNFVLRSNRVRFEIDEASAAQSGLSISSKLLSLAVKPEG